MLFSCLIFHRKAYSSLESGWKNDIECCESDWKNDIEYCESGWKNVHSHTKIKLRYDT